MNNKIIKNSKKIDKKKRIQNEITTAKRNLFRKNEKISNAKNEKKIKTNGQKIKINRNITLFSKLKLS